MSHMISRMLDEHTAQIGFYYRYALQVDQFIKELDIGPRFFHSDQSTLGNMIAGSFAKGIVASITVKMKQRGLIDHSEDELSAFTNADLQALSDYLGSKTWFQGGTSSSSATRTDCAVFGHLSQFLYMPWKDFPPRQLLCKYPNLVDFMARFKARYWPDWDDKCQRQPNQRMLERIQRAEERKAYTFSLSLVLSSSVLIIAGLAHLVRRQR